MMPEGVIYHASWMDAKGECCFHILETFERALLDRWVQKWEDLVDFEVSEVTTTDDFWTPQQTTSTIYEMVMAYPMHEIIGAEPPADVRRNISEALREALLDPS